MADRLERIVMHLKSGNYLPFVRELFDFALKGAEKFELLFFLDSWEETAYSDKDSDNRDGDVLPTVDPIEDYGVIKGFIGGRDGFNGILLTKGMILWEDGKMRFLPNENMSNEEPAIFREAINKIADEDGNITI